MRIIIVFLAAGFLFIAGFGATLRWLITDPTPARPPSGFDLPKLCDRHGATFEIHYEEYVFEIECTKNVGATN